MSSDSLEDAEKLDGYRASCQNNRANREARKGQLYELSRISNEATDFLREAIEEFPIVRSCEFAILDSTADDGLPHTRPPNLVCLPANMCKSAPASTQFKVTLVHEAMHVHQRKYKTEWDEGCKRAGWTPLDSEKIPAEFKERARINPDTMATPFWAWDKYHVPLPLFRRPDSASLTEAPVEWMDLRTGSLFHSPPPSFVKKYGDSVPQAEHPYEIYADLFSRKWVRTHEDVLENLKRI